MQAHRRGFLVVRPREFFEIVRTPEFRYIGEVPGVIYLGEMGRYRGRPVTVTDMQPARLTLRRRFRLRS